MNPDSNFITSLFNISPESIESFITHTSAGEVVYELTLKRTYSDCPYCGGKLIGYGHKTKMINHPILSDRLCYIKYHANRYRCTACGRTGFEHNPFTMRDIIFSTFPVLRTAYGLKELYRKFNKLTDYDEACALFPRVKKFFADSGIEEYNEFSGLLYRWETEILNSFIRPYDDNRRLSNAYTENLNGKIRTYIDVSRGIKNFDRFRKRVIYALNPDVSYALTANLHSEKYKGKTRGPYEKAHD